MDLKGAASAAPVVAPESYTILRIKRKRHEEPLDALVFDAQSRKRTKSGKGGPASAPGDAPVGVSVFQFAETVEGRAWADQKERRMLQERITALAKDSSAHDYDRTLAGSPGVAASPAEHPVSVTSSSAPDAAGIASEVAGSSLDQISAAATARQLRDDEAVNPRKRRYTIVRRDEDELKKRKGSVSSVKFPTEPPKVVSARSLEAAASRFNMYDAVLSADTRSSSTSSRERASRAPAPAIDSEMDKFLPMLQDYLKISDIDLVAPAPTLAPLRRSGARDGVASLGAGADETRIENAADEDDYVWDVFYYRPSLSAWNAAALGNFGSLTGLPPSINDPDDSDSDSEPEDDDDEDSNAEDYYKNDYPDEEDGSGGSDEFHEDSDYDDFLRNDDDEEHDWR